MTDSAAFTKAISDFDPTLAWEQSPQVSIRPESFGALAYHHATRRLLFLKSRELVSVVQSLGEHATANDALRALVATSEHETYRRALARLAKSEVIRVR